MCRNKKIESRYEQITTHILMSFKQVKKVTLIYDNYGDDAEWELEGDFTRFIEAVKSGEAYADFDTTPKLMVEGGVITLLKEDFDKVVVRKKYEIDSLMKVLTEFSR